MTVDVRPATADLWEAVGTVLSASGDGPHCWCQWFRRDTKGWLSGSPDEREHALHDQLTGEPRPPGLVAFVDGEPAGWCAVAPRPDYLRLRRSRKLHAAGVADDLADDGVWAVTCFVVRPPFRRQGLTRTLLDAATDFAVAHGATTLEAYPIDVPQRGKVVNQELFVGTLPTFLAAGFEVVGRSAPARPVVRRAVG